MNYEIDGKDHQSAKAQPQYLEETLGRKTSKFSTKDEDEYAQTLKAMNKADLQNECLRIFEHPHDERSRMEERLMKAFRRWNASNKPMTSNVRPQKPIEQDAKRAENIKKVIAKLFSSGSSY